MDQIKPSAAPQLCKNPNATHASIGNGQIFPSEVRAVLSVLGEHLQRSPGATEISRLKTSAAPDPDVYLLFFDDVYLGTITRRCASTALDTDEFLHTPPGLG